MPKDIRFRRLCAAWRQFFEKILSVSKLLSTTVYGPCFQIITIFFLVRGLIKVVSVHMHVKEKGTVLEEQHYYIID